MISETKLGRSFPIGQFQDDGFHNPYRGERERDRNKDGSFLDVRKYTPSKLVSFKPDDGIEKSFIILLEAFSL